MKKYKENDDYFLKIDDERKAYWLGFLYADGCISINGEKKNKYTVIIQLHPADKYILELFLEDIESNRKVSIDKRGYVFITIGGKKFSENLIRLGCVQRKSLTLEFPSDEIVPQEFKKDFIRGYMDGDGCISVYAKERKNTLKKEMYCEIKFIGTFSMIDGIRKFFKSSKKALVNKHSPSTCQISFAGRKYKEIVELLYSNAERYLVRKKEKWNMYKRYMYGIDNKIMTTNEFITINKMEIKKRENKKIEKVLISENEKLKEKNKKYKMIKLNKYKLIKENKEIEKYQIEKNINCENKNPKEIFKKELLYLRERAIKKNEKEEKIYIIDNKKWKRNQKNKIVEQYSLDGKLIKVWENVSEIAVAYNTTSKAIRKVCNKERKSCKGYVWKYREGIIRKKCDKIAQYTMEGTLIKEWKSVLKAAEYYNVTEQAIRRAVTGKYKSSCGFRWKKVSVL
ncbi:MAG: hypothetical protein ACRC30_01060 [Clostridium sp.]